MKKIVKLRTLRGYMLIEPLIVLLVATSIGILPLSTPKYERAIDTCISHQKQITLANMMYVQENNEKFPGAGFWADIDVGNNVIKCPVAGSDVENAYAFNANIASLSLGEIYNPVDVALTADSDTQNNMMYSAKDLAFRHEENVIISFIDGHVTLIDEFDLEYVVFKEKKR